MTRYLQILQIGVGGALAAGMLLAGSPAAGAAEGGATAAQEDARSEVLVTFRVETAQGAWMRFKTRPNQMASIEIHATGERYGLRPIVGGEPEDVQIEVVRLDQGKAVATALVERVTARVGFPSFLATESLRRIDVEAVDLERPAARAPTTNAPRFGSPESTVLGLDVEFEDACCVTCDGVTGCGCYVAGFCGSCCDCCETPPKK